MNKNIKVAMLLATATFGLGGCATVINGTNQPVDFQSDPDGALIELIDSRNCVTPCAFEMRRGHDSKVTFTKDGYQPVEVYMQSRLGGTVAGNVIAGGLIGGVLDGATGASNHLYPNPVYVRLVAVGDTGEPLLLDEEGEVISTVAEYNASVEEDVLDGIAKRQDDD